ncbi:MAG: LytTR family DNA-binding domain-containing protein [Enhydrobacter sp.]
MRESPYFRSLPYHLPSILGVATIMAVTGPFGTYNQMGIGTRLAYFGIIALLHWIQIVALAAWFGQVEPIDRWPLAVRMALVGLLASVPGTFEIILLHSWLWRPLPWSAAWSIYPDSAFLTVVISVVFGLVIEQRLRAKADAERARVADLPQPNATGTAPTDFFRRIPPALGRDLLALEMEDHYLRIHTALGSELVLLRLRDAMAELGTGRGRQVHRSWWVAEGAVASAERGARPQLVLRNGLKVPVSKTYRDALKGAGWL